MKGKYEKMWRLAVPYLKKGKKKDFVLHTKMVVRGMELLLKKEKGNEDIVVPAAILHDTGWSNVPVNLQKAKGGAKARKGMELHLQYSVPIIREILSSVRFDNNKIKKVTDVVLSHKYKNPRILDKRLLIDADTLSDAFKEQFYSDAGIYGMSPKEFYHIRKNNKFYTETARDIFKRELKNRAKEIGVLGH
jgi:hypothetical protein